MFDVGFTELLFIGLIALLVLGPERLPRVARTAGLWLGKARSMLSSVKADIDRELAAEELKKALAKQAEIPGLHDIIEDTKSELEDLGQSIKPDEHLGGKVAPALNGKPAEPETAAKTASKPDSNESAG